jgi:cysteine desulfuration protein SufE
MGNSPFDRQNRLIEEFQGIADWESRYKKIIEKGRALPPFPEDWKDDYHKVRGCQSQVWVHAKFEGGRVYFEADSDASIVKGLVAMLLEVFSNASPQEIIETQPDFLAVLGMNQNLSQSRVSGLASMIKQIKIYALAYQSIAARK